MSGHFYELPTTESFSFSSCYGDAVGSHIDKMAEATERRANLRTLLKDAKRNSERDYLKLVKVRLHPISIIRAGNADLLYAKLRPWMTIFHCWPE